MADRAGIEFMLPIGRWKGYGGATDYQGATFETVTWASGLLAKTERKRTCYGSAIQRMCELALAWLDRAGLFHTTPDERRIELHWPSPIPVNELERLQEAAAKVRVGIPKEVVLRELGY